MISGHAKLAGVIGWPVAHSLSPRLHNYWLAQHAIDGAYIPLAVAPEHLRDVIHALPSMGFQGVNLTIPHKEAVLPLLDYIDEQARRIGAVNTIVIREGKLHGSNTDSYGFAENIKLHLLSSRNKAVILGAGGAARGVVQALINEGFRQIIITNRTIAKAKIISDQFGASVSTAPWELRNEQLAAADILVNTTSLGLQGKEALNIDLATLPLTSLVTDIVYSPLITPLLAQAQARGNPIVDGLGMLLHQAVPGFAQWFGVRPEVDDALRAHVLHA